MHHVLIPSRFRGPTTSGHGGWSAGALAELLGPASAVPLPPVEVTLRMPPPLERELITAETDDTVTLNDGDAVIATARLLDEEAAPTPVPGVALEEAKAAREVYAGRHSPFPQCFACGIDRAEGDGLRLFTGPVHAEPGAPVRVACDWTPDLSLADEGDPTRVSLAVVWAALDCPGAWSIDLDERAVVLGRMSASIDALPLVGEPHVVMGELRGNDGRKWFTASTVHDADGRVVARAEHTWIEIDPAMFA